MIYFLSSTSKPLKYLACGNMISKNDFLHHQRTVDFNVLIMIKEGTLHIAQNDVHYQLGPNEYILLSANQEHYGYQASTDKLSYLWVHFEFCQSITSVVSENMTDIFVDNTIKQSYTNHYIFPQHGRIELTQRVPLLFNQLLDLSRQAFIYNTQMIDYALSLLVMELSQIFIQSFANSSLQIPPKISSIMEWIRGNYYKPITIAEIANEFGYNTDYLSSLFKKSTGISLVHYINKTRIDISKSLIINYDLSVKEAAYACGFSDEKYYMKNFKKFEGMTPTQYKKAFSRKMIN